MPTLTSHSLPEDKQAILLDLVGRLNGVDSREELMAYVFVGQEMSFIPSNTFRFETTRPFPYSIELDEALTELERQRLVMDLTMHSIHPTAEGKRVLESRNVGVYWVNKLSRGGSCSIEDLAKVLAAAKLAGTRVTSAKTKRESGTTYGISAKTTQLCQREYARLKQK